MDKHVQIHDLSDFTLKDMTECGAVLRKIGLDAKSMEETANRITQYFYEHLINKQTGEKACTLVRFFKTHSYQRLNEELRQFARNLLADHTETPEMKCLILLATTGERPEWNSRKNSIGHKAIPLPSKEIVNKIPMIQNLIKQLGLDINTVINPAPKPILDLAQENFNVFHVPNADGSSFIPFQQDFVIPYGVKSVIGFGGILPLGDIFVTIIFSKVPISEQTANLFRSVALNVKMAVIPFERLVFA